MAKANPSGVLAFVLFVVLGVAVSPYFFIVPVVQLIANALATVK